MSDSQACCAHLRIGYLPEDHPGGYRTDHWECVDCGERFYPSQHDQRKARLLDEFAMAALTGICASDATAEANPTFKQCATNAYTQAEACVAEKEKRQAKPKG